ncbi:MAG TPA: polyprenyl synthetase family protein [Vicinamibacterales bacterium]|nr:polyprenyl synthetase family protein [Acidobacteriota bacterium]HQX83556.1 polyprenyl synthetase family protein [Vicinamibacterales bacterium]
MNPSATSVPDLGAIFEPVREALGRVEQEFARHLESKVDLIPQMGRYIQMSGGKRVRPAVLLLSARMCGYTGDRDVLNAAVVEFIHTATLVHDDIIDEAETRRGRLAAHSRWGNDVTVLLGDYLYIRSMAMALTQDSLEVVRLLCEVTLRMIEGELYQLTKMGDGAITEDEHLEIIRRKTAYLFSGCAEIGGVLGNCTPAQRIALREYGFNLGIAFQIVDDVLDYTSDEAVLGKPIGGDLREGKVTLPIILLQQRTGPDVAELIQRVVTERQVTPEAWQTIKGLLATHGAVDAAYERAVTFAHAARTHLLDAFPSSVERDGLASLADYVLQRDR